MSDPTKLRFMELTKEQVQSRRSRALGIAVSLALLVLVLYAASFARLI